MKGEGEWLNGVLGSQASEHLLPIGQPLSFGLVSGFCSGFFVKKVGKLAVVTAGIFCVVIQVAAQQDYLKVNWPKIEKDYNRLLGPLPVHDGSFDFKSRISTYITQQTGIASGAFIAGFFLGFRKG